MTWQNLKYVALRWTFFFEICGIDDVALFRIYNIHRYIDCITHYFIYCLLSREQPLYFTLSVGTEFVYILKSARVICYD